MTETNPIDIPRTLFADQAEAINFLVSGKEIGVASKDGKYVAMLCKEGHGKWIYTLNNVKDDLYVGEYLQPFRCSHENIEIFHAGTDKLADLLLELEKVPHEKRDDFFASKSEENFFGPLKFQEEVDS